ncbi:MAG: response regulator [Chloroflexota bacterium]
MTVSRTRQHVLVVDDDPACRALLNAIFDLHGFEVTSTDSVFGLSELIARVQPSVIVLDVALPYRSGASWLVQLKANPATSRIPVVILSAVPDVLPRERLELAQAVVRKPFRSRTLVQAVQAACDGARFAEAALPFDRTLRIYSGSSQRLGSL